MKTFGESGLSRLTRTVRIAKKKGAGRLLWLLPAISFCKHASDYTLGLFGSINFSWLI
jgi:hypothetical protein